jgi:hypothetical protein
MKHDLLERFTGAARAAKLMDHRTPQAMTLLAEHHLAENTHDIRRITNTYGENSRMVFNNEAFDGLDALEKAHIAVGFGNDGIFSDIKLEVFKYHQSTEAITVEFGITATQTGQFGDIAPTGKRISFPAVGIYTFDIDGKLIQENITFDAGGIARQLTA